jgi:hypothetical protein
MDDFKLVKNKQNSTVESIESQGSILSTPPPTVSPTSPYYTEIPATSGDMQQRIINTIPKQRFKWARKFVPSLMIGLSLFGGSVFAVFMSNAFITLSKEKELEALLKERDRLLELKKNKSS